MPAIEIKPGIWWVGVNVRSQDLFEGLWPIPDGVSLNSYIVKGDKVAVIDLVREWSGGSSDLLHQLETAGVAPGDAHTLDRSAVVRASPAAQRPPVCTRSNGGVRGEAGKRPKTRSARRFAYGARRGTCQPRRDAAHLELRGQFLVFVGIDFGEDEATAVLGGELLQDGLEDAAGLAPFGPEVDDDRHLARCAEHPGREIGNGDVVSVI